MKRYLVYIKSQFLDEKIQVSAKSKKEAVNMVEDVLRNCSIYQDKLDGLDLTAKILYKEH